jgi:hypothetical protein
MVPRGTTALAGALLATALLAAASTLAGGGARRIGSYPALGCQIFPHPPRSLAATAPSLGSEAAWNQNVSRAPVDPRSDAYISYINAQGGRFLHPDFGSPRAYGIPYAVVGRGQAKVPIHFAAYGDESDPGPYPVPPSAPVEGGARSDGDRHVLVVQRGSCRLYELYRAFYRGGARHAWRADSGAEWDLGSARRRHEGDTSADAAGLPIFPGLVRLDEARDGPIRHAFRITFESIQDAWIHPASHCAGDTRNRNAPPMGLRLRLRRGYPLSGFSGPARSIARALKDYGVITADNGSNWYISGTSDSGWPDGNLNQLKRIPGSAFEIVKSAAPIHRC